MRLPAGGWHQRASFRLVRAGPQADGQRHYYDFKVLLSQQKTQEASMRSSAREVPAPQPSERTIKDPLSYRIHQVSEPDVAERSASVSPQL